MLEVPASLSIADVGLQRGELIGHPIIPNKRPDEMSWGETACTVAQNRGSGPPFS